MSNQHKINIGYLEGTIDMTTQPGLYNAPPLESSQTVDGSVDGTTAQGNAKFFYDINGLKKVTSEELFGTGPRSVIDTDMNEDTFVQVGFPDDWRPNGYIEVESETGFLRVTSSATSEGAQGSGFKVIYLAYY